MAKNVRANNKLQEGKAALRERERVVKMIRSYADDCRGWVDEHTDDLTRKLLEERLLVLDFIAGKVEGGKHNNPIHMGEVPGWACDCCGRSTPFAKAPDGVCPRCGTRTLFTPMDWRAREESHAAGDPNAQADCALTTPEFTHAQEPGHAPT